LSGVAASALPAQLEGAVQLTTPTGSSVQGKFTAHADHEQTSDHDH
jgi:hypothetical protein